MSAGPPRLREDVVESVETPARVLEIAGPGVYICDECIGLCNVIIDDEARGTAPADTRAPSLSL